MGWKQYDTDRFVFTAPHIRVTVYEKNSKWLLSCSDAGFTGFPLKAKNLNDAKTEAVNRVVDKLNTMISEMLGDHPVSPWKSRK